MTREEAIRILDPETTGEALAEIEYYNGFSGKTAAVQAVSDACVLAVAALREQEEQENLKGVDFDTVRKWIPASEPPKDSEHVLVCTKHRKPFKARYYPDRKRWDVSGSVVITHWMPLPDPPREDKR